MVTRSKRAKKMWANPEYRAKMSKERKERWANPEYRKKMTEKRKEVCADPEYRKRMSETCKETWADPKLRKKLSENAKKLWTNPEYRKNHSERMKMISADPEYRKKMSKTCKQRWTDPELREKKSKIAMERWTDPELRAKISGENASNWQGGLSFKPYPPYFNDYMKMKIRERDGYKCVLCDSLETLSVHHINYDKEDLRPKNLITLCNSCHGKTGHNRDYWEAFLTPLTEQKEPLKFSLVNIKPLSQDPMYSIIGGISNGI